MSRPTLRDLSVPNSADSALVTSNGESISSAVANQSKRRAYHGLLAGTNEDALNNNSLGVNREKAAEGQGHTRNRSLSEYVPGGIQVSKARNITLSGHHALQEATPDLGTSDSTMRREPHLAIKRGLAPSDR